MHQELVCLQETVGKRITHVARALYVYRGERNDQDGPLELGLEGGIVLLDGHGDGERLRVRAEGWKDPFEGPLDEESRRFVEDHGKWTRFDLSRDSQYRDLIGELIREVTFLKNVHGTIAGVKLTFSVRDLWFFVDFDESYVQWALPNGFDEVPRETTR
jgi:hypothetical protein